MNSDERESRIERIAGKFMDYITGGTIITTLISSLLILGSMPNENRIKEIEILKNAGDTQSHRYIQLSEERAKEREENAITLKYGLIGLLGPLAVFSATSIPYTFLQVYMDKKRNKQKEFLKIK